MKYLYKFLCSTLLVFALVLNIFATESEQYLYVYSDIDVTVEFSEDTLLTNENRVRIADHIVYNTPLSQTYSFCWLLGHDITVDTVTAIYHKKSEYAPRCQLEVYHVDVCSNCDYTYARLVSSSYISCCPPDASAVSLDD